MLYAKEAIAFLQQLLSDYCLLHSQQFFGNYLVGFSVRDNIKYNCEQKYGTFYNILPGITDTHD